MSRKVSPSVAIGIAAVAAFFGWGELRHQQGEHEGFEAGRNPYSVPVQPRSVVCGPQYGLHDVSPGETAEGIAAQYGIDTHTMLRFNNLLEIDGSFDPRSLRDDMCLRVDSAVFAAPGAIEAPVGVTPGWTR